jgi:uncharacterized protein YbjQ (UPF0145 family)
MSSDEDVRSGQSTGSDAAAGAAPPESYSDLEAEPLPAGARIHQAVQTVQRAPITEPSNEAPQPPTPTAEPEFGNPESDPAMDLFGASLAAPDAPERLHRELAAASRDDSNLVVDLRSDTRGRATETATTISLTDTRSWGDAAQGWVRNQMGGLDWHPVVTTADRLDRWEIDVPLGLVSVDVMLFGAISGDRIAMGRRDAIDQVVAESVRRGGHAVVSVTQDITQLEGSLLVTVAGAAATLRDRANASR